MATRRTINGAWYIDSLPQSIIMELADGSLVKFTMTPFRDIVEGDWTPYNGIHPRKCLGLPVPSYLLRLYGLAVASDKENVLSEVVRVRISPSEKQKLEAAASNAGETVSELLRRYVREL